MVAAHPGEEDLARRVDAAVEDLRDDGAFVVAGEESLPRHELPEHDAGRVDVRLAADRCAAELLRRHVRELALDLPLARRLHAARGLGHAEVEHAGDAVRSDEDVLRGHVSVDDAERNTALVLRFVRGVEAVQDARHDRREDARRERLLVLAKRACEPGDRLAGHVLHDEEQLAAGGDDIQRGDDVRVPDARGEASLVEEHRDELGVRRELRVEPLDRHRAGEADRSEQTP